MLAAAARDAKSKAIVLKSLAFASLPEEIREEAELRAAATEYRTLWGWVCGGVCALRTRVTPRWHKSLPELTLFLKKARFYKLQRSATVHCCHTVTLSQR